MGDRWENTAHDHVPDELLELVFLGLPSSLHLVRAACTCKRWRRVVADGGFLRRFQALHPRPVVAGQYRVDERKYGWCPPGRNPVFSISPSADTTHDDLRPQHFSLDFLPTYDRGSWDLADSRCGILLLCHCTGAMAWPQLRHLVVCDPTKRRCSRVIAAPPFHDRQLLGAFLLDSDADEDGVRISLTNFRIIVALYDNGIARSCVFSSSNGNGNGDGGGWALATSKAVNLMRTPRGILFAGHVSESVYWTNIYEELLVLDKDAEELKLSSFSLPDDLYACYVQHSKSAIVRCEDGALRIACLGNTYLKVFIQAERGGEWTWEKNVQLQQLIAAVQVDGGDNMLKKIVSVAEGSITFGTSKGMGLLSVNLATMEFKCVPRDEGRSHGPAHVYQLPWPPTIRACLT